MSSEIYPKRSAFCLLPIEQMQMIEQYYEAECRKSGHDPSKVKKEQVKEGEPLCVSRLALQRLSLQRLRSPSPLQRLRSPSPLQRLRSPATPSVCSEGTSDEAFADWKGRSESRETIMLIERVRSAKIKRELFEMKMYEKLRSKSCSM